MVVRRALFTSNAPSKKAKTSAAATSAMVKRAIYRAQETKHQDGGNSTFFTGGLAGVNSTNTPLTAIGLGNSHTARIGNKIRVTGFNIVLVPQNIATLRVALFCPKDASVVPPSSLTLTDILDSDQYWVWYDRMHNAPDAPSTGTYQWSINLNLRKIINVQYSGTSGFNYSKNPVFMHIAPNNTLSATNLVEGRFRTWYKDA